MRCERDGLLPDRKDEGAAAHRPSRGARSSGRACSSGRWTARRDHERKGDDERKPTHLHPPRGRSPRRTPAVTFCSLHLASPPNAGSKGTRMTTVRAALVQCAWTGDKDSMIQKHVRYIADAAKQGAKVMCLQELFYGPYFCQVQDTKHYSYTEKI